MTRLTRLTSAQALVRFLANQWTERDGVERRLIAGWFGSFGHGNVAGIGEALLAAEQDRRCSPARNPQAHRHTPAGPRRPPAVTAPGLCARCQTAPPITTPRGSTFWRSREHDRDPAWPRILAQVTRDPPGSAACRVILAALAG